MNVCVNLNALWKLMLIHVFWKVYHFGKPSFHCETKLIDIIKHDMRLAGQSNCIYNVNNEVNQYICSFDFQYGALYIFQIFLYKGTFYTM